MIVSEDDAVWAADEFIKYLRNLNLLLEKSNVLVYREHYSKNTFYEKLEEILNL
jgi:hypothetical protein